MSEKQFPVLATIKMTIEQCHQNGYEWGIEGHAIANKVCMFAVGNKQYNAWYAGFNLGRLDYNNGFDEIGGEGFTTNEGVEYKWHTLARWLDELGDYVGERHKCGFIVKLQFRAVAEILRSYLMK